MAQSKKYFVELEFSPLFQMGGPCFNNQKQTSNYKIITLQRKLRRGLNDCVLYLPCYGCVCACVCVTIGIFFYF